MCGKQKKRESAYRPEKSLLALALSSTIRKKYKNSILAGRKKKELCVRACVVRKKLEVFEMQGNFNSGE